MNGEATWTDHQGHFWLFGGNGIQGQAYCGAIDYGALNTLWELDPATSEWTWWGGSSDIMTQVFTGQRVNPRQRTSRAAGGTQPPGLIEKGISGFSAATFRSTTSGNLTIDA